MRLLWLIILVIVPATTYAQPGPGPVGTTPLTATGTVTGRSAGDRAADVYNIADGYGGIAGAKCDGTTDDTAAINATLAAAAASAAYQISGVTITGPMAAIQAGCKITSALNLTAFTRGSGTRPNARPLIRDLTLLCSGAGVICMDGLGARAVDWEHVAIVGDATTPPEIGVQVGVTGNGNSAAWHDSRKLSISGHFTFANFYEIGSEVQGLASDVFSNVHSASGPINGLLARGLGTITAGSAYTNGTYTSVPLTGGVGNGALATIVVAGTVVTSVSISYEGRDYAVGDVLSAAAANIGGTGTGFSVPVTGVKPWVVVLDSSDHWRATSTFVSTASLVPETFHSNSLITFYGGDIRQEAATGTGGAVWENQTNNLRMVNTYIVNTNGASCIDSYDTGTSGENGRALHIDANCEGNANLVNYIFFTGPDASSVRNGMYIHGFSEAVTSQLGIDTNINPMTLNNADLAFDTLAGITTPIFDSPTLYSGSGRVQVQTNAQWNSPKLWLGTVTYGTSAIGNFKQPRRTISSGSSDTATVNDALLFWKSASGVGKTETVPNCGTTADGKTIKIVDEQGDAGTNAIVIAPASSGTIGGGANYSITSNYGGVDLVCDGSQTNWVPS